MSYQLTLVTPNGKIFEGPIDALRAPGAMGSFGVLGGHAPIVAALKPGVLKLTQNNQEKFYGIAAGVLEVDQKHNVLILSNAAVDAINEEDAFSKVKNVENN
ncbi:MAG TPA: ATP synthase F1 subunit epsilon [Candidatus Omnitrophota bacterium]|nr:ATP synthase F1 subunit epsilon [Candidatus Omnitrophota bacterium]